MRDIAVDENAVTVDNRGLLCAQGVLRLMRALGPLSSGQLIRVVSTDPAAASMAICGVEPDQLVPEIDEVRGLMAFSWKTWPRPSTS